MYHDSHTIITQSPGAKCDSMVASQTLVVLAKSSIISEWDGLLYPSGHRSRDSLGGFGVTRHRVNFTLASPSLNSAFPPAPSRDTCRSRA
jgi:hypothetical protein